MNPLVLGVLAYTAHQSALTIGMEVERHDKFRAARRMADSLGKPLLVVGGPYGTSGIRKALSLPAHGHGDICVDLDWKSCGNPAIGHFIQADVRELPFEDGEFGAVFNSHILEHLDSCEDAFQAISEMHRVGAGAVFTCVPPKSQLAAAMAPGHRLWVEETGYGWRIQDRRTGAQMEVVYQNGPP